MLSKARSELGVVRTEVWEFMSVVSPLVPQVLLNLVTAWLVCGTGFACLGTRGLISWHPRVGAVIPCVFHHPRLFCPHGMLLPPRKGLPVQSHWWDWDFSCPVEGRNPLDNKTWKQSASTCALVALSPRWEVWGLW